MKSPFAYVHVSFSEPIQNQKHGGFLFGGSIGQLKGVISWDSWTVWPKKPLFHLLFVQNISCQDLFFEDYLPCSSFQEFRDVVVVRIQNYWSRCALQFFQ